MTYLIGLFRWLGSRCRCLWRSFFFWCFNSLKKPKKSKIKNWNKIGKEKIFLTFLMDWASNRVDGVASTVLFSANACSKLTSMPVRFLSTRCKRKKHQFNRKISDFGQNGDSAAHLPFFCWVELPLSPVPRSSDGNFPHDILDRRWTRNGLHTFGTDRTSSNVWFCSARAPSMDHQKRRCTPDTDCRRSEFHGISHRFLAHRASDTECNGLCRWTPNWTVSSIHCMSRNDFRAQRCNGRATLPMSWKHILCTIVRSCTRNDHFPSPTARSPHNHDSSLASASWYTEIPPKFYDFLRNAPTTNLIRKTVWNTRNTRTFAPCDLLWNAKSIRARRISAICTPDIFYLCDATL